MTYNNATRNALATAFANIFNGGTLEIRTAGGTALLATINLPATAFSDPSNGQISRNGTWSVTASGSGVARVARFVGTGGATAEVTVGESGSGANLIIDNENIVSGGTVTVNTYTHTVPA